MNEKIIEILLKDRTTGKNIIWATGNNPEDEIFPAQINLIEPRYKKNSAQQKIRARKKAEIFTPYKICKRQNDLIDDENIESTVLEITCGEAPYLVSRYDVVTGEPIPFDERTGILDRKLRRVGKIATAKKDWLTLAEKAVQSVYGYEFQGDNLFLARQNIFLTYVEYYEKIFADEIEDTTLERIAEIISWNLWQMDGLTNAPPFVEPNNGNLFDNVTLCRIRDWKKCSTEIFSLS